MKYLLLFNFVFLCSMDICADWKLNNEGSSLSFVTVKNGTVVESHRFRSLSGKVRDDGEIEIEIDLNSADTLIPIRDERIASLLFETKMFPKAILNSEVALSQLLQLKAGDFTTIQADSQLNLHGESAQLPLTLTVTKMSKNQFYVTSKKAVIVDSNGFNLVSGIEALRKIAGLKAIAQNVPVSFSLLFEPAL